MSEKEPNFIDKNIGLPKCPELTDLIDNFRSDTESALQLKYPKMDRQMNEYMERADANDPTCVRVSMDDGKRIDFNNKPEENEEVIFTFGLCGCIATALVLEMKDGTEKVIMTHNSPLTTQMGSVTIRRLGEDINPEEIKKAKVFILAPGIATLDAKGDLNHKIEEQYRLHLTILKNTARTIKKDAIINEIAYSTSNITGLDDGYFGIAKLKNKKLKCILPRYLQPEKIFI